MNSFIQAFTGTFFQSPLANDIVRKRSRNRKKNTPDPVLLSRLCTRFVNNPEKVMGHAAFWGMTLICNSWSIFILALFSQISNFLFLHFVESPHMRKIYGDKVRKDAGVVKTVKAASILPQKMKDEVSKIREKLEETPEIKDVLQRTRVVSGKAHEFVEGTTGLVQSVAPRIQEIVSNSKALLENSKEKLFVA